MKHKAFDRIYFDKLEDIRDKGPLGELASLAFYDWSFTPARANFL